MKDKLTCIGIIVSSHGIKGAVKIKVFIEDPSNINLYGKVVDDDGNEYKISIISIIARNLIIAKVNAVETRTAADKLKNIKLYVEKSQLPFLAEGEFYYADLVGMKVNLINDDFYGYIRSINNFGSCDIVEISLLDTKKTIMLPFSRDIFPNVNLRDNCITLMLPKTVGEDNGRV